MRQMELSVLPPADCYCPSVRLTYPFQDPTGFCRIGTLIIISDKLKQTPYLRARNQTSLSITCRALESVLILDSSRSETLQVGATIEGDFFPFDPANQIGPGWPDLKRSI